MQTLARHRWKIGIVLTIVGAVLYLPVPVVGQMIFFASWLILGRPIRWRLFVFLFVLVPLFILIALTSSR